MDDRTRGRRWADGAPSCPEEELGDIKLIRTVQDRIEDWLGPIEATWCVGRIEDRVHVDLHWVPPTPAHPWHWILTTGMSELPMDPPEGFEDCRFAEVYICLPPDWPLALEMRGNRDAAWPVGLLAELAQFPHQSGKWMWFGHTFTKAPIKPIVPGVGFVSTLLGPPISMPRGFNGISIDEGRTVWYFSALPIFRQERALAMRRGSQSLLGRFQEAGVTDLLDVHRPNLAGRRRR